MTTVPALGLCVPSTEAHRAATLTRREALATCTRQLHSRANTTLPSPPCSQLPPTVKPKVCVRRWLCYFGPTANKKAHHFLSLCPPTSSSFELRNRRSRGALRTFSDCSLRAQCSGRGQWARAVGAGSGRTPSGQHSIRFVFVLLTFSSCALAVAYRQLHQHKMAGPEYDYLFKLLLIGDSGVGKVRS